jgi:tRNA 2-thiouridine synthesizing protein B
MPTLHTVNKSPFERDTLKSCLSHATPGASVLLIEDGVFGATKGTSAEAMVTAAANDVSIYVLGPDVAARGLNEGQILSGVKVVDYNDFVDLVDQSDKVQAWL